MLTDSQVGSARRRIDRKSIEHRELVREIELPASKQWLGTPAAYTQSAAHQEGDSWDTTSGSRRPCSGDAALRQNKLPFEIGRCAFALLESADQSAYLRLGNDVETNAVQIVFN